MVENVVMKTENRHIKTEAEMAAHDAVDPFLKLFNEGLPLGDIIWKLRGEIIPPHPVYGYDKMFSSPISQLDIPCELLEKHGLLDY